MSKKEIDEVRDVHEIIKDENIKNKLDKFLLNLFESDETDLSKPVLVSIKFSEVNDNALKFLRENNAKIRHVIKIIKKIAVEITLSDLARIIKDDRIISVNYDRSVYPAEGGAER